MPDTQTQPKIVQVPSIGNIQFPGDMADDQISAAIQKNYPQLSAPPPMTRPQADAYITNLATRGQGTYQPPKTPRFADVAYADPESPVFGEPIKSAIHPDTTGGRNLVPLQDVQATRQRMQYEAAHPDDMAQVAHSQAMDTSLPLADRLRARSGLEVRKRVELGEATNAVNEREQNYTGGKGADAAEAFAQFMARNFQTENPQATPGEIGVARSVGKNVAQTLTNPVTYAMGPLGGAGEAGEVAMSALFAAGAAKASYDAAGHLGSIWDRPDISSQQKTEMASDLILNTAMAGMMGRHAVKTSFLGGGDPLLSQIPQEYRNSVRQKVNSVITKTGGVLSRAADVAAEVGNSDTEGITQQGLPTTAASGMISRILGGGEKAMAKAPIKQQTAAGPLTNAQVASYAKSKGIELLPGQGTGASGLQTVQAIGERAVVAPGELPDVLEKQKAAFGNLLDDFKTRVGTEAITDTEAAGTSLKSQAQAGLDNLKESAQQDYRGFENKTGDIPVNLSDVKAKAAASLASQAEALRNTPTEYANPIKSVLNKLANLEAGEESNPKALSDFNSAVETYGLNPEQQIALRKKLGLPDEGSNTDFKMSTAQQLRSAYLDISRDYSGNIPKSIQRYAGQAAKDIDVAMAKAADSAGATDQWRQANAKWKQLQGTYNNPEHPLYKVLQEPDPSQVPTRLLGKGNYGGSPQTVRQLQQAGIDLSPLKREVTQQISQNKFAIDNGGNKLGGFSTEFLKTLYTPAEFNELTTIGRISRAIKFEVNTSGTSNVMEGHRQIHGIITRSAGAVVGPLASRLTTSKAFARATMGDVQPRSLADILGSRGPEPPPETPPASGAPVTPASGPTTPPAPKASAMAAAPRSLADIFSGKPIDPTSAVAARLSELKRELLDAKTPEAKADIQQAIDHLNAVAKGEPFHAPEQAAVENLPAKQPREIEPGIYNRETKVHTPGKPQSVTSAVHDVLGENPSPEHRPTTPQQPMEAGKTVAGNYGNDTAVKTTTGSLPAKYKIVEADSLIPSHNAQTFAKNPQYPEGVQERAYHTSKEAQARVIQQAQNYDPAYTVNTNPDAVNGPPVVTKDGIVLGGNSRTMSTQRLYKAGAGDAYKNSLRVNASQFGVTPAAIDSMRNPVLVREVETPANIEEARRIGADLNKNMTGALGQGEKAVSAGRSVKPATLQAISDLVAETSGGNVKATLENYGTADKPSWVVKDQKGKPLAQYGADKETAEAHVQSVNSKDQDFGSLRAAMQQHGKDFLTMMQKDGVITERERPRFTDTATGGLNEEGKTFVERALIGSVVDDPRLMDSVPKSVLGKLEGSLGDLAKIGSRTDEYNIMPLIREALQEHAEIARQGTTVAMHLGEYVDKNFGVAVKQHSMFAAEPDPALRAIIKGLAGKPAEFRKAIGTFAEDSKMAAQHQGLLGIIGDKPTAVKSFNKAFGTNLTEQQFHEALLQSAQKEGTIGNTSGHPDQTAGSNEGVRQASPRNAGTGGKGKTSATQAGGKTADQPQAVAQRSLSDILSGKPSKKGGK